MGNSRYQPNFNQPEVWTDEDRYYLYPFVTSIDGLVTVLRNLPAEMVGALCSRASRAAEYLPRVFLNEYIYPILRGENKEEAEELKKIVAFYHYHGVKSALNNDRAKRFFVKNLAQYGDESIAQTTGVPLILWGISQVAMKFLEDRRIGLAPIEKSTRYVDFSKKVDGKYLYYADPDIVDAGLGEEYRNTMDFLFETNADMIARLKVWLREKFPEVKDSVIEKKAFDTARGLLPMSTLGQVAFAGNGQAYEYLLSNCYAQKLGELRWIAEASRKELDQEIGSLLLRLDEEEKAQPYQKYLAGKRDRILPEVEALVKEGKLASSFSWVKAPEVKLVQYDPDGEAAIVAGILFPASNLGWGELIAAAKKMNKEEKRRLIAKYLEGRGERWQKVGRALENAYLRFEIVMNAGAYRDLHRHRIHTQERQLFTISHEYDVPSEIQEAGMADLVHQAMEKSSALYQKILNKLGAEHAQYATTLYHRVRFYQYQNVRQAFWEIELRTTSQGHPDYRKVEQEKFKLIEKIYPIVATFIQADMKEYDFARRGTEEKMQKKEGRLLKQMGL